ncbi:MAG: class I SAM-dependent methyltransferase [Patescibacteria group bacterium]|nr:class I SAM-dependent methyltransferase [Patescibacteria group bacterium]
MNKNKFDLQNNQYNFPYHYLVNLREYSNYKELSWGIIYYAYMKYTVGYVYKSGCKSLLDVGCGDGRLISELASSDSSGSYVGVDLSESAILLAKAMNQNLKNAKFLLKNVGQIEGEFDIVVLNEVLEHIPDEDLGVFTGNVMNKVKSGGVLIVTVPSVNVKLNEKHFRHYNLEMLRKQFEKLKLLENETKYLFKKNLFYKIIRIFAKRFRCPKLELFLAKKFLFNARDKNCTDIFVVFKRK